MNGKKHGEAPRNARWLDAFSSAREFAGWSDVRSSVAEGTCASPRCWLLGIGWKKHGLLASSEAPKMPVHRRERR